MPERYRHCLNRHGNRKVKLVYCIYRRNNVSHSPDTNNYSYRNNKLLRISNNYWLRKSKSCYSGNS